MRLEYIDPFVESAIEILNQTVTKDIDRQELTLTTKSTSMFNVVILVGLAGKSVNGRFIMDMEVETALKIASIMNSEEITVFDELTSSTLMELANMIVGNAVTRLHKKGFKVDLTPPALLTGKNIIISDNKLESLIVPLVIPQGKIQVNVAIKET